MKVRRDVSSVPHRSAKESWDAVKTLVIGSDSLDANQFDNAASVMESLIADEIFDKVPLTLAGVSHRVVIYFSYGFDAIENGNNVDSLAWNPTAGDWTLYVPCDDEQYEWAKKTLAARASRFIVHKKDEAPQEQEEKAEKSDDINVNWGAFGQ